MCYDIYSAGQTCCIPLPYSLYVFHVWRTYTTLRAVDITTYQTGLGAIPVPLDLTLISTIALKKTVMKSFGERMNFAIAI